MLQSPSYKMKLLQTKSRIFSNTNQENIQAFKDYLKNPLLFQRQIPYQ
jgi:hypothetical protein